MAVSKICFAQWRQGYRQKHSEYSRFDRTQLHPKERGNHNRLGEVKVWSKWSQRTFVKPKVLTSRKKMAPIAKIHSGELVSPPISITLFLRPNNIIHPTRCMIVVFRGGARGPVMVSVRRIGKTKPRPCKGSPQTLSSVDWHILNFSGWLSKSAKAFRRCVDIQAMLSARWHYAREYKH